ncbi:sensor domain-containing diguanylate cyclase [Cobetia sp. 14N.309.X.WAT.E.A4]|uniref:sensor domain-containing diguanylate cyclase n=1 Tax=Cobetia sp. 14N.309.X.WAT.E.A4 TaxID=2998323 RepID=UPI0025B20ABB|nr:sensor domain-containing diguanylate cyclase [Cobetia sp. 14N.309.X.WAT.E.A4]MDN2657423.1 sensor domain-containing diguanylate cyclase [Cobetia sp. 14N.309.X.WAT.E.A4]
MTRKSLREQSLEATIQQMERDKARLERRVASLEEKLSSTLDGTGLRLWQLEVPTGKLTIFNYRWGRMLGYQPGELNAHFDVWRDHLHPEDRDEVLANLEDHLAGRTEVYQVVHRMLARDGSITWVADRGRVVERDANGKALRLLGTHTDISHEKDYETRLNALASTDALTGLSNRQAINGWFKRQLADDSALLFIDVDGFKQVNDALGHRAGDEVLVLLAHGLNEELHHLGVHHHLAARFGGDEFLFQLPRMTPARIEMIVRRWLARFGQPLEISTGQASIGLSIGVCFGRDANGNFATALEYADQAMYRVKRSGKHGYHLHAPSRHGEAPRISALQDSSSRARHAAGTSPRLPPEIPVASPLDTLAQASAATRADSAIPLTPARDPATRPVIDE